MNTFNNNKIKISFIQHYILKYPVNPITYSTFDELLDVIRARAKNGEIFIRLDLKPPFPDTPENWEDKVESVFSSYIK